ncbi:hypothetical protein XA68_10648 [Ophiocordyceps unilateralis]|uniref:Ankyrin repeat domain-containing protein n=1 Tax=Ophiocordyceps unilateralis TaxID=268505 RepID=A0A2A9NYR5_OPHUN|nr:hypothetical protein XA68_10648 [Ophiocordyceps unilateralis]
MDSPSHLAQLPLRATPELVEKLRRSPDYFEIHEPEELTEFLDQIKAGDYDHIYVEPDVYTQIIDSATGDSVLQIAVRAGSLEGVEKILDRFGRSRGRFAQWSRHALFVHRNKAGDNCLHMAARKGILDLLIMVYRAIDDDGSWPAPWEHDTPNVPENRVYGYSALDESSSEHLLMLLTENSHGRTPAAEARAAGHDSLAQFLDDIVERLDPKGDRRSEAGMAKMLEIVRDVCHYDLVE